MEEDGPRCLDDTLVVREKNAGGRSGCTALLNADLWWQFVVPIAKVLQDSMNSVDTQASLSIRNAVNIGY